MAQVATARSPLIEISGSDLTPGFVPTESPDVRVVRGGTHRFVVNSQQEPIIAEGWLIRRSGTRAASDKALHLQVTRGVPGWHAAHLIPDVFGGPDIYPNLVPFPGMVNTGHWKQLENSMGELLKTYRVYLKVFVQREPGSRLPDHVVFHIFKGTPTTLQLVKRDMISFEGFLH